MWIARDKSDQNQAVLDPWTGVHAGWGLAAGLMELPAGPTIGAAVAYEVVEQYWLERGRIGQVVFKTSGPETLGNAIADLVAFGVGYYLGRRWNTTAKVSR